MPVLNQSTENVSDSKPDRKSKNKKEAASKMRSSKSATTSSLFETSSKRLSGSSSIPKALNTLSDSGDEEDLESTPVITGNEVGDGVDSAAPTAPLNKGKLQKAKKKNNAQKGSYVSGLRLSFASGFFPFGRRAKGERREEKTFQSFFESISIDRESLSS